MSELAKQLIAENLRTQNTYLDLGNCGLSDLNLIPSLFECLHVETLILSDVWWEYDIRKESQNQGKRNYIRTLPNDFSKLKNLKKLICRENQLSEILVLKDLTNLTYLDISKNQISDISPLQYLTNLINLDFWVNQVTDIGVLQHLTNLTNLNFHSNQVTDIGVLQHLTNLTNLYFPSNLVTDIGVLQHLTNLTTLNFSSNLVTDIGVLQHLTNLTTLNFSSNLVTDIGVLQHLTNLTNLNFHSNQVTDIGVLQHLTNLKILDFSSNLVTDIGVLQHLTNLTNLNFHSNQVTDIGVLQHLTNLKILDFSSNRVTDIGVLQHLTNLKILSFSSNQVTDIGVLQHLINLTDLGFDSNQVTDIGVLQHLTNLVYLFFKSNQVKILPTFFATFDKLYYFGYDKNPFARYVPHLWFQNAQEKIQYILDLQANSRPIREAKVVLVGDGKIGKTTLLGWLLEGKKPRTERTDKIEIRHDDQKFSYYNADNQQNEALTVHFWDFGGQDIMHATHKFFMTERTVYVLVTDHRNLKENEVKQWLKYLETTIGNSPVILVANQCDKANDKHRLKDKEYRATFENLNIREVIETSGENGKGVHNLQKAIQTALQELEFLSFPIPTPFFQAKEKLLALKKPYISYEKFEEICQDIATQENYNFGEGMQDILANLLNDLGILLSFKQTANQLDTLQVFQPEWIVNGVYALVVQSNSEVGKNKGILTKTQVEEILKAKKYTKGIEIAFITGMLKEFKLAYSKTVCGEEKYFIPSVFDDNRPFELLEFWDKPDANHTFLRFRYTYENWRTDLINYVIVEEHEAIKENTFWKNGVVLSYNYDNKSNQIFVESNNDHNHIDLIICGTADLRLTLEKFRKELMPKIHGRFTNLGEKEWIIYEGNGKSVSLDYQELVDLLEMGETHKPIPKLGLKPTIKELLGYVDLPPEPVERKYARLIKEGKKEEAELLKKEYLMKMPFEKDAFEKFSLFDEVGKLDKEVKKISKDEIQNIINFIESDSIGEAFGLIDAHHLKSPALEQLRNEFIKNLQGVNFHARLQMAVEEAAKKV
jgi:internalin A